MHKTSPSKAGIVGSIPGCGARIPDSLQPKNQSKEQKQHCGKLIEEFLKIEAFKNSNKNMKTDHRSSISVITIKE